MTTHTVRRGPRARVMAAFAAFAVVEYAAWVAVLLWAYDAGGAPLVGVTGVAQLVPALAVAPLLGSIGDRLPRGAALCAAYAAESLALVGTAAALAVDAPTAVVVVASAAATTCVSVARPLHFAALPHVVGSPAGLVRSNAGSGVLDGVGVFVGPILAGLGAAGPGPEAVLGACAIAMATATALTLRLGLPRPRQADTAVEGAWRAALGGLRVLARDLPALMLLGLVGAAFLVTGALEVLGIAFADVVLGDSERTAGLLLGATGAGAVVGAALSAGLATRRRLGPAVVAGAAVAAVPLCLLLSVEELPWVVLLLAIAGAGQAVATVAARTLLQRGSDDAVLARVMAVQEGVMLAGLALGAALAPVLIAVTSAAGAYAVLGAGLLLSGVATARLVARLDGRASHLATVVGRLRGIRFLTGLDPVAMQRLAVHTAVESVPAGVRVVTAGQPGDSYYVLVEGWCDVTPGSGHRPRALGPGDGFGEIALLRGGPRTATVTAATDLTVLVVPRAPFLAAVTGRPDGRALADEVAAAHLARDSA